MISSLNDKHPQIGKNVFVAKSAQVIGDVTIGENSSVWFNSVVRGDVHYIRIGKRTNIQDSSVLHVTRDTHPLIIGDNVTIAHRVVVHGCTINSNALVGIGSIVLDGAIIESNTIIAAGSVVPPGFKVPGGVLAMGSPVEIKRDLKDEELVLLDKLSQNYVEYSATYISQSFSD